MLIEDMFCQQGSDLHCQQLNDEYMDNTADASSDAMWAELDLLEATANVVNNVEVFATA